MKQNLGSIVRFYADREGVQKPKLPNRLSNCTLTNVSGGLGDTVVLTAMPRSWAAASRDETLYVPSWSFTELMQFNPHYSADIYPVLVAADRLRQVFDLGNGHIIQRLQRAFGVEILPRPHGCVVVQDPSAHCADVIVHLEASGYARQQRTTVHPRAREVYPETLGAIEALVRERPSWTFAEVGRRSSGIRGVLDWTGLSLPETIRRMASARWFVGIPSGPLHIAAALNLRLITIVNFPVPDEIWLPVLKDVGVVDVEWLYPQGVTLHQDSGGPHVPKVGVRSLHAAFEGAVFPYEEDHHLNLVYDRS